MLGEGIEQVLTCMHLNFSRILFLKNYDERLQHTLEVIALKTLE
jgi:hypothetical protein